MSWLVSEGRVLASLEVAGNGRSRLRGLLGRDTFEGALLIRPARSVHTLGMRFPLDVAFCSSDLDVLATRQVRPHRLPLPPRGTRVVIEAEAGAFERWGLVAGQQLEVRS
ncbi:MAG: DUF192 domain-containing protein [Acidimicrobiia bacterium]|nr:DUF192 domain-containing protein [Acidimicrobiia bacterium]